MTDESPTGPMRPDLEVRYLAASHAMQSGVLWEMQLGSRKSATMPKHLRVGINMALCSESALIKLLVRRGLCTQEEYDTLLVEELEAEVARYEVRLTETLGRPVSLK